MSEQEVPDPPSTTNPVLLNGRTVISQDDLGGGGPKLRQPQDGKVLVVQRVIVHDEFFHLFHHGQHPGFALVCPVGCRQRKGIIKKQKSRQAFLQVH